MAAALVFVGVGCSESVGTGPSDSGSEMFVGSNVSAFELLVASVDFEDATVAQPVRERPDPSVGRPDTPANPPHPFARLLHALNLTAEQRAQVADMLGKFHECTKEAHQMMRKHQSDVIAQVKAAREEILKKLEAGEITREEAIEAIRALNARAREALRNSNIAQRIREMLVECEKSFLRSLSSILTEEQQAILKRYLNSRGFADVTVSRGVRG